MEIFASNPLSCKFIQNPLYNNIFLRLTIEDLLSFHNTTQCHPCVTGCTVSVCWSGLFIWCVSDWNENSCESLLPMNKFIVSKMELINHALQVECLATGYTSFRSNQINVQGNFNLFLKCNNSSDMMNWCNRLSSAVGGVLYWHYYFIAINRKKNQEKCQHNICATYVGDPSVAAMSCLHSTFISTAPLCVQHIARHNIHISNVNVMR